MLGQNRQIFCTLVFLCLQYVTPDCRVDSMRPPFSLCVHVDTMYVCVCVSVCVCKHCGVRSLALLSILFTLADVIDDKESDHEGRAACNI